MGASLADYDGLAGIAIAVFVLAVVFHGNGGKLFALAKGEAGFLKWALALFIVRWLGASGVLGQMGPPLTLLVYVALAMKLATNQTMLSGISSFWKKV